MSVETHGTIKRNVRDVHEQLLVGITAQFRIVCESLCPSLAADSLPRIRCRFIECRYCVKVDLLIQALLERRSDVIRVIVISMGMVVIAMCVVLIMTVRH